MARSLYHRGKSSLYPLHRGVVSLRASLDPLGAQKNLSLLPQIEALFSVCPGCILGDLLRDNLCRAVIVTVNVQSVAAGGVSE